MSAVNINLGDAINVLAPIVFDIVKTLRERKGSEPTLEEVQAEMHTEENVARAEAEAFYLRHPEQRQKTL